MSYDIEFFRLAEGVTVAEINEFLNSEEYNDFEARQEEMEENDEEYEATSLPSRFVDTSIAEEELRDLLGRALLRRSIPEDERTPELQAWLDGKPGAELPSEHEEDLDLAFDFAGSPGTQPMLFTYSGDIQGSLELVAGMLEDLRGERIVVLDPQIGAVIDGTHAREILAESAGQATAEYQGLRNAVAAGLAAPDDDEDYDDDDEDDEEYDDEDDEDYDDEDDEDFEEDEDDESEDDR